jgi:hypothetical protein
MTTFEHPALPTEPSLGAIVEDHQGRIWHHVEGDTPGTSYWRAADLYNNAANWHKLLDLYAPLTIVRDGETT